MTAAPSTPLRVLVADDDRLMLSAVRRALDSFGAVDVVAALHDPMDVLPAVREVQPDVVLLDLRMPQLDGLTCLARVKRLFPELPVVMFSASADPSDLDRARAAGAQAYIVKTVDPCDLGTMILAAVRSPQFLVFRPDDATPEPPEPHARGLTERESVILCAVARGLTNKEIGRELWLSEQTVKFHLRNVYRKLGVTTRTEAARYAISRGVDVAARVSASA